MSCILLLIIVAVFIYCRHWIDYYTDYRGEKHLILWYTNFKEERKFINLIGNQ